MLSLTDGPDSRPIAYGYKDGDEEKTPQFVVYLKEKVEDIPDIQVNGDVGELLDKYDIDILDSRCNIDTTDIDKICRCINNKNTDEINDRRLRRGFRKVSDLIDEKLKKQMDFRKDKSIKLRPIFNKNFWNKDKKIKKKKEFLGHQGFFGCTGVGKSYGIKQFLIDPEISKKSKRKVYWFSRVDDDPVHKEIKKIYKKRFIKYDVRKFDFLSEEKIEKDTTVDKQLQKINDYYPDDDSSDELIPFPDMSDFDPHSIVIFDDVNTLDAVDKVAREKIFLLMKDCLECARHVPLQICVSNHIAQNYQKTRVILNECMYYNLYPRGNFNSVSQLLKARFGMKEAERNKILKTIGNSSRWMVLRTQFPLYIISEKMIYVL